jgi:hypothetical protein
MMIDEISNKKPYMRRIERRTTIGYTKAESSFDLDHCKSDTKLGTIPENPLRRKLSRRRMWISYEPLSLEIFIYFCNFHKYQLLNGFIFKTIEFIVINFNSIKYLFSPALEFTHTTQLYCDNLLILAMQLIIVLWL